MMPKKRRYDLETQHGIDPTRQAIWDAAIDRGKLINDGGTIKLDLAVS
ncbi:MAG: hypothetical protein R3C05_25470 [Pirellulaceae bacterium]